MASSRSLNSPEAELRHWLQDLLLESSSVEEAGRELRRTAFYGLKEVSLGGGLAAVAVSANEAHLQLDGEKDPEYAAITERLAEECHRFAKLRHPNVLQFLGVYFPKGSLLPMIITEQLEVTLSQCLHRFNNIPESLKTSILLDVSLGLECFHESTPSIPHGNLIASNIFLTPSLTAKLTYPPIYKVFGESEMEEETPNHFENGYKQPTNDLKEDVFMLGELMVHVIAQRRPKRSGVGQSPSLIQQIEHVNGSHALRGLILQCLQKDPILRPTASEIAQEIKTTMNSRKTQFQDPIKVLEAFLSPPASSDGSPKSGSPKDARMKRIEAENQRLHAQLKVTQSELRHLRVQQTLFGGNSESSDDEGEGERSEKKQVELMDAATQVDILQVNRHKVYIELHKETSDQSLGFSIAGGKGAASTYVEGDQSIFITRLASGGLAEKDGRLKPGDRLISVNGTDMTNATRSEALTTLMESGNACSMVITREEVTTDVDTSMPRRRTLSVSARRKPSTSGKLHPLKLGVSLEFEECSPLPECLSGGQAIAYKNKIIVGGQYSSNSANIYEYDPETDSWTTLAKTPGIWFFGLTVFQDKITVVGGFNSNTQTCSARLFSLNEKEGTWLSSLPPMATPRMHPTAVSLGSSLVVAGGRNNSSTLNCIEVFNFSSQQWYMAHPLTLERSSMRGLCHNGHWYLLGGELQGFPTCRVVYTPLQSLVDSALHKTGSVSCFKAIRNLPNTYSAVALSGGKIVAIGGNNAGNSEISSVVYALCEEPFSWLEVGQLPIPLNQSCAISLSEEEVLIIGGCDETGKDTDVVYRMYLQEISHKK